MASILSFHYDGHSSESGWKNFIFVQDQRIIMEVWNADQKIHGKKNDAGQNQRKTGKTDPEGN